MVQGTVVIDHGFDLRHLGIAERISADDDKASERGGVENGGVPIASAITELKLVELGEELQPVVAGDDDGRLWYVVSDTIVGRWPQAERFQRRGVFRAGPTLRQRKVHFHKIPRSVKIHVDETALDLETLKHFRCRSGGLVTTPLCGAGVGEETKVERSPFRTVEEGRPTFRLAIPVAPQVLGIDRDFVPAATHEQEIERSGFCGAMRTGGPDDLQESEEDGFENFRGDLRHRKVRVVSGFPDYIPEVPVNCDLPAGRVSARFLAV